MPEYIEREALALKVRRYLMPNVDVDGTVQVENAERYFLKLIEETPAADVVEVVRCKDCNNSAEVACGVMYCCYFNKNVEEDGFCYEGC